LILASFSLIVFCSSSLAVGAVPVASPFEADSAAPITSPPTSTSASFFSFVCLLCSVCCDSHEEVEKAGRDKDLVADSITLLGTIGWTDVEGPPTRLLATAALQTPLAADLELFIVSMWRLLLS